VPSFENWTWKRKEANAINYLPRLCSCSTEFSLIKYPPFLYLCATLFTSLLIIGSERNKKQNYCLNQEEAMGMVYEFLQDQWDFKPQFSRDIIGINKNHLYLSHKSV